MFTRFFTMISLLAAGIPTLCAATFEEMNAVFGAPLWIDENLWDDPADDVAARLGWPQESKTSTDSSFRKYPGPSEKLLGARPYSLAFFGEGEKAARVSMMFANKGDSVGGPQVGGDERDSRDTKKLTKSYAAAIENDGKVISEALIALLGPPTADRFGQGRQTRESVQRWDWQGHSILLASPAGEYVAVRILPTAVADSQGKARIPDADLRARLESRVLRRENGDVVLTDIPMVDQGPKGYCVPATWERAMRYMAIPADMYALAMAGDTGAGEGTSVSAIVGGAKEAVTRGGRRLDPENAKLSVRTIKKFIDRGLPVMWTMFSMDEINTAINARMKDRKQMTDPTLWDKILDPTRKAAKKIATDQKSGHMCMIIGYNEKTGELAVSDSWGPEFAERWITEEEAIAVTQGPLMVINF
jgi:hypothetical protein